MKNKKRSPRNRTITLSSSEMKKYSEKLVTLSGKVTKAFLTNKTIHQDLFEVLDFLPQKFIDLLIIDPPYNMDKTFNSTKFREKNVEEYTEWVDSFMIKLIPALKKTASIYVCGDWKSSPSLYMVLSKYFEIRNRITWEREKGRGAKINWKNNSEDIWYCTVSNDYVFNPDDVKLKRKVVAPYRGDDGLPKDWEECGSEGYRLTYPSNIWTDISIPFWSMPENTEHPTQKPEKLIAKLILASTDKNMLVFDPFLGSGTTSVVAKKLGRKYLGVEIDKDFACLTEKRLEIADTNKSVQGYGEGVFWERNSSPELRQLNGNKSNKNGV